MPFRAPGASLNLPSTLPCDKRPMIQTWLYGTAASLAALGVARLLFLLLCRRPVLGHTRGSELSEMEREHDRDLYLAHFVGGTMTPADYALRPVLARIRYEVGGVAYAADLSLPTFKGERPDSLPTLWYDPSDPRRVTAIGPSWALLLVALGGAVAAVAFYLPI